tara:strand:+ start:41 stop:256 length:216 start_codon:yes stop_codon:yes gene_type:complete
MSKFSKSDIVEMDQRLSFSTRKGLVIATDINMWGEETVPSGVRVMWQDGDLETLYEDEIDFVNDRDSEEKE